MSNDCNYGNETCINMCKKIAQLTKVIYQLNSMNEEIMNDKVKKDVFYEEKIDDIVKDASAKLSLLNSKMNAKEKTIAYMRQELSDEKRSAEEQLDKLKSKITSMESVINTDIDIQINALKQTNSLQVEEIMNIKVKSKQLLGDIEANYSKKMQKMIHELTSANNLYIVERNDMALRQEETIKRLKQIHVNDMDRIKQELLSSQQKSVLQERKENNLRLNQLRKELEDRESSRRADLNSQHLDEIELHAKESTIKIDKITREKINILKESSKLKTSLYTERERNQRSKCLLSMMQKNLELSNAKMDKMCLSAKKVETGLHQDIQHLNETVQISNDEITKLQQKVFSIQKELDNKESTVKSLCMSLNKVNQRLTREKKNHDRLTVEKDKEIRKCNDDLNFANESLNDTNNILCELKKSSELRMKEVKEKLAQLEICKDDAIVKSNKVTTECNEKIKLIQKEINTTRIKADNERRKCLVEIDAVKKEFRKKKEEYLLKSENKFSELKKSHAIAIQVLKKRHYANLNQALNNKSDTVLKEKKATDREIEEMKTNWAADKLKLLSQMQIYERKLMSEEESKQQYVHKIELERSQMLSKLRELTNEVQQNRIKLSGLKMKKEEITKLWKDEKSLNQRLQEQTRDLQANIATYKNIIKDLKRIQSAQLVTFERKEKEIHDLYHTFLEESKDKHTEILSVLQEEKVKSLQVEREKSHNKISHLIADYEEKLIKFKEMLDSERRGKANILIDLERKNKNLCETKRLENQKLQYKYEKEREDLRNSIQKDNEEKLTKVRQYHDVQIHIMKEDFHEKMKRQEEEYKCKLEETIANVTEIENKKNEQAMHSAIVKLRKKKDYEFETELEKLSLAFRNDKDASIRRNTTLLNESNRLRASNQFILNIYGTVKEELSLLKNSVNEMKSQINVQRKEFLSKTRKNAQLIINDVILRTNSLRERMQQERFSFTFKLKILNQQLESVSERWKTRGCRPEDLEKINSLEARVKLSREREIKAKNDMLFYKQELINREENFNSRFCRPPPNVGVMEVVSTKSENICNKVVGNRKKSTKMRRNTSIPVYGSLPRT